MGQERRVLHRHVAPARRRRGPTVIVSPLLALMRNQVEAATRLGIHAVTINSVERARLGPGVRSDRIGRMRSAADLAGAPQQPEVPRAGARPAAAGRRPRRRRRGALHQRLGARLPARLPAHRRRRRRAGAGRAVLCTTATANDRVIADIERQLASSERPLTTVRGSLDRASLRLEVVDLPLPAQRLAWLATHLPALPGSGLVYCATVRDTELVASWLQDQGLEAVAYSGETDPEDRERVERRLTANQVKAVVATSALGMGYDKPDLGFVVHFQAPGRRSPTTSRSAAPGRGLERAHAVLLRGARGPRHPGLLHRRRVPAARAGRGRARGAARRGRRDDARAARAGGQRPPWPTGGDAEGPRGRRRGRENDRWPVGRGRERLGLRPAARRCRHRAATCRAGRDGALRQDGRVPHGVPAPRARRPGDRRLRSLCDLHGTRLRGPARRRAVPRRRSAHPPPPAVLRAAQALGRTAVRRDRRGPPSGDRRRARSVSRLRLG